MKRIDDLSNYSYDDLDTQQKALVVEQETKLYKKKIDELRKSMSPEKIEETIHDWWLDYKITNETEENLLGYV